MPPMPLAA